MLWLCPRAMLVIGEVWLDGVTWPCVVTGPVGVMAGRLKERKSVQFRALKFRFRTLAVVFDYNMNTYIRETVQVLRGSRLYWDETQKLAKRQKDFTHMPLACCFWYSIGFPKAVKYNKDEHPLGQRQFQIKPFYIFSLKINFIFLSGWYHAII